MVTCRCTNLKHPEHLNSVCENLATESDGYCKACHDRSAASNEGKTGKT